MPGRQPPRKKDPFQRIHSWDDGYDYIQDTTPSPPSARNAAPPFFSPSPVGANRSYYEPDPPRRSKTTRRGDNEGYPDERRRPRSPPPYREARSPSPPRRRDRDRYPPASTSHRPRRPSLDTYPTAPLPRSNPPREPARSPSPPRHRRNPDRDLDRDRDRDTPRRHRSPSPPRKTTHPSRASGGVADGGARPPLTRSKTTTAATAAAAAKERFNNLSPQWKAAAMAAFQAGSMAALQARKQPGGWNGEKGAKIATAALGAAAMGALKKGGDAKRSSGSSGAGGRKNSGVEAVGGALGGFLADQFSKREGKKRY
ncbi:hypothetical protein B0T16DRAFT_417691 [Cercophora newfieldiana]|uniref:Uncharacterized protein n=1 Tax=Cercophora newfieldiana TaxID=92897 RepID=A0AA39Y3K0_9PEZI|nr:hypothetical protein B0T16DRAFT_417691 [Cercophora newfieldiana]